MLDGPLTDAQLRQIFGTVLNGILDGTMPGTPDGVGLDEQTSAALNDLALNLDKKAAKTLAAYDEFAKQLDGTHLRELEAETMRRFFSP